MMHIANHRTLSLGAVALAVLAVAGCATGPSPEELDKQAAEMMQKSFRDEGIAKVDRIAMDPVNAECSKALGKPLSNERSAALEKLSAQTIVLPADGKFLGDWKKGEAIAQNGRGLTFTDSASVKNGGNCYNCHQISKDEISFGTIGPSLYQYGKLRGVSDPNSAAAKPIVEYTWGKLYNARATNACSQMPRFGHAKLLSPDEIRDVMALLLDPASPINAN